jgi:hypothetical protein
MNLFDSRVASSHASVQSMSSVDAMRRDPSGYDAGKKIKGIKRHAIPIGDHLVQGNPHARATAAHAFSFNDGTEPKEFRQIRLEAIAIRQRTRHLVKWPELEDHKWLNIENIKRSQLEWQNPTDTRVFEQD